MKQPSRIKIITFLLCSIRQKHGVLGFTCVIGSRQAGCQTPFIQGLIAPVAYLSGSTDAAYGFESKRDGIRKV